MHYKYKWKAAPMFKPNDFWFLLCNDKQIGHISRRLNEDKQFKYYLRNKNGYGYNTIGEAKTFSEAKQQMRIAIEGPPWL